MKKQALVFQLLLLSILSNAQEWRTLGEIDFDGNEIVSDLLVSGDSLFVGGHFMGVNGMESIGLFVWDSLEIQPFNADGLKGLAMYNDELYLCGGWLSVIGGEGVAKYEDGVWINPGGGATDAVYDMCVYDDKLFVCGTIGDIGELPAPHTVAAWDNENWLDVGGIYGGWWDARVCTVHDNEFYVGGSFGYATGDVQVNNIARYDGEEWSAVGGGLSGMAWSLLSDTVNNVLYAGGDFSSVDYGKVEANSIAKWDGESWSAVGTGLNANVHALCMYRGQLYAGGSFTTLGDGTSVERLARFDGVNWNQLGSGVSGGFVNAMAVYKDELYVGGGITNAGDLEVEAIARWYMHPDSVTWGIPDNIDNLVDKEATRLMKGFPNPTQSVFHVEFNQATTGSLILTDMVGCELLNQPVRNQDLVELDLFEFPPAKYLLHFVQSGMIEETIVVVVSGE